MDPNAILPNGNPPIVSAARDRDVERVTRLLQLGAHAGAANVRTGTSALMTAAKSATTENNRIVAVLLRHVDEADVNARDGNGNTALIIAAKNGNVGIVQRLVEVGADVNRTNAQLDSPLIVSAAQGSFQVVRLLVEKGAEALHRNKKGDTALTQACFGGNERLVRYLLTSGLEINAVNCHGFTPLTQTCQRSGAGRVRIVRYLVRAGATVNHVTQDGSTPLLVAAASADDRVTRYLLENSAHVNVVNKFGCTALNQAIRSASPKTVQLLLASGARVSGLCGESPLIVAAKRACPVIFQLLLERGADVNQANESGRTPLFQACETAFPDVRAIKFLIGYGANVNHTLSDGTSPLLAAVAVSSGVLMKRQVVGCLLENGADVNQANRSGTTAFQRALKDSALDIVSMLLANGAEVTQRTPQSSSLLALAAADGFVAILECLLQRGFNFNEADEFGRSPLLSAAMNGKEDAVQFLLEAGARAEQRDRDGNSVLIAACETGLSESVIRTLVEAGCSVNATTSAGDSALLCACRRQRDTSVIRFLVESGADLDWTNSRGEFPVLFAARSCSSADTLEILVNAGARTKFENESRRNPLVAAMLYKRGAEKRVRCLLQGGADVNAPAGSMTPLKAAIGSGLVPTLLQAGAVVTNEVHSAICFRARDDLQILILNGAVPAVSATSQKDWMSDTLSEVLVSPLAVALMGDTVDIAKYLLSISFLCPYDLHSLGRSDAVRSYVTKYHKDETVSLYEQLTTQPWPLVTLSFVAVSSMMGESRDRQTRVQESRLPMSLQRKLRFQDTASHLPVSMWPDINVSCFPDDDKLI